VKRIVARVERCLACRSCEIACALAHSGAGDLTEAVARGARPRIYLVAAGSAAVPLQCRHCADAPCVRVCPSGALGRAGEEAPVLADPERCIGCGFCVEACPFGVIRLGKGRRGVLKCDLCQERRARGEGPACVAACPVGALAFEDVEEDARRRRTKAAREVAGGRSR